MINDNLLFFYFAEMIPPQRRNTPPDLYATQMKEQDFLS